LPVELMHPDDAAHAHALAAASKSEMSITQEQISELMESCGAEVDFEDLLGGMLRQGALVFLTAQSQEDGRSSLHLWKMHELWADRWRLLSANGSGASLMRVQ